MKINDRAKRISILANDIAEKAASLCEELNQPAGMGLADQSKMLISVVERRDEAFNDRELFSQPIWEMLLKVFSRHLSGDSSSVSDICEETHLPVSTTRRWLHILERQGWISISGGGDDWPEAKVHLTEQAITNLSHAIALEQ